MEKKKPFENHILFTDDVMLFSKENVLFVKYFEEELSYFVNASGLKPNMIKRKIIFSKGVKNNVKKKSNFKKGFYLSNTSECLSIQRD